MSPRHAIARVVIFFCAALVLLSTTARLATPRFYDDDPIAREPESQDASGVKLREVDFLYDFVFNLFATPRIKLPSTRAHDINTIDEVPDSNWFTNRIYANNLSIDAIRRGPNTIAGPAPGRWDIIRPKSAGAAPGFTVRDTNGDTWFLQFDAAGYPGAATGAVAVAARLFWALGYFQVESYLTSMRPENLAVASSATIRRASGSRRPMTMEDVRRELARAARNADGSYRVLAGRAIPGRIVGGFQFEGTRPDDPNDIVPHENRRSLRALRVFGAWTNMVDVTATNTLDTVVIENGRSRVRHYLQDVGSTFGTGANAPHDWHEGFEYLYEGPALAKRLFSLGFYLQPWQTTPYVENREIGRFEGDAFDPETWVTHIPAAALLQARPEDTFWAALRVAAFTDDLIRAAAETAEYRDPAATNLLATTLMKRRDKIAQAYLPKVNPLVNCSLSVSGQLQCDNAAVRARVAEAPAGGYRAAWSRFDNATGTSQPLGETTASDTRLMAPAALPDAAGTYLKVSISAVRPAIETWGRPIDLYFKRLPAGWKLVGLERDPQ